jgi:hypothetical protein
MSTAESHFFRTSTWLRIGIFPQKRSKKSIDHHQNWESGTSIQSMEPLILSMLGFFVFGVESPQSGKPLGQADLKQDKKGSNYGTDLWGTVFYCAADLRPVQSL